MHGLLQLWQLGSTLELAVLKIFVAVIPFWSQSIGSVHGPVAVTVYSGLRGMWSFTP